MSKKKKILNHLMNIDQYISAAMFVGITVLLTAQVVSRYVFNHSFTWTEELAIILYVYMTYFGISSAVTYRKHLRIDAVLDAVSFKAKRVMLIVSDIIFIVFNLYLWFPFTKILSALGNAKTMLLGIPKQMVYIAIPFMLTVASVKLVVNIVKLTRENEQELGATKPSIDLDACEREYLESLKEGGAD